MDHTLRVLLGCLVPLLLLFLLPLIGLGEGVTLVIAIVLMFACHLFMIGDHQHTHADEESHNSSQGDPYAHS